MGMHWHLDGDVGFVGAGQCVRGGKGWAGGGSLWAKVASASYDKTVKVFETDSGSCTHTLRGHSNTVFAVAAFPSGDHVVSASHDGTLKIWQARVHMPCASSGPKPV